MLMHTTNQPSNTTNAFIYL